MAYVHKTGLVKRADMNTLFAALTLPLLLLLSPSLCAQERDLPPKIIVQFDTNTLTDWKSEFGNSIKNFLKENRADFPRMRITYDFLNVNYYDTDERPVDLINELKHVQSKDPAALIISEISLGNTNTFMEAYGQEVYPGVPRIDVIPFGTGLEMEREVGPGVVARIGGIRASIERSIELVPQLLPELKNLYVTVGDTAARPAYSVASRTLAELPDSLNVEILKFSPFEELLERISDLPDDSAVFILSADASLGIHQGQVLIRQVKERADAPVFSYTNFNNVFEDNLVGGNFVDPAAAGELAIRTALNHLFDASLTVTGLAHTTYQINVTAMEKWGIDPELVPPGSILVNQEFSAFKTYRAEISLVAVVMLVLFVLMVFFRQNAKQLATQKTLFKSVIDSIPDAVFLTDEKGSVFIANDSARELFGYSDGDMQGASLESLILDSPANPSSEASRLTDAHFDARVSKFRTSLGRSFSGESISKDVSGEDGTSLGHVTLVRDISKRLLAEQAEQQREKMEALGNLVGGIAHDFNNVLGVISGYAELALSSTRSSQPDENMTKVLEATERAKSLVSQIMSFSKDKNIEQTSTRLDAIAKDTLKLVSVSVPKQIELSCNVQPTAATIRGAPVQIQQIIINLITNAYQAIKEPEGLITLDVRTRHLEQDTILSHGKVSAGEYCVLTVSDNGPGMEPDVAANAFDPFFSTKSRNQGAGMGLAIVYNLVRSHDAVLNLATSPEGTAISIYFKKIQNLEHTGESRGSTDVKPGNGERIMLVEDERDLLEVQSGLLTSLGFVVESFDNPGSALSAFEDSPTSFDLILSDENMPKMSGIQMLEKMHCLNPEVPAIICTGYGEALNRDRDLSSFQGFSVLRKPYTLGEISRAIDAALS